MYAIVTAGGKQHRVLEGDVLRIERIDLPVGDTVELGPVSLLVKDDGAVTDPEALANVKVVCHIVAQGKAKKVRVFKRKRCKNYARTKGHRQLYTDVEVAEIVG